MRLQKFTGQWGTYLFPDQTSGNDNFLDLVPRTTRLPGINGGWDSYSVRPALQSVGNVDASWWLIAENGSSMRAMRDAVSAMGGWGKQRLFIVTNTDEREDRRWTWARVSNIRMSENVSETPYRQQRISASFQVADPGWKGGQKAIFMDEGHIMDDGWRHEGALYMDEGLMMDSGLYSNPVKLDQQMNSGDSATITNYGTREAAAILSIGATGDEWVLGDDVFLGDGHYLDSSEAAVGNISVTMYSNGQQTQAWTWGSNLEPGEILIVDAEKQSVSVVGRTERSGYSAFQRRAGYGFLRVPPGESTISITGGINARGCRVIIEFWDEYYSS